MQFRQYLNEISQKELDKADIQAVEDSPFNNIFGNKLRIVIPLTNDQEYNFEKVFTDLGMQPDLRHGTVNYTRQTQKGEQTRTERIGSILQKLTKQYPDQKEKWQKMLDWWQKNSANVGKTNQGVSIIISRAPIDIVRMSDHREWHSCHSVKGSYWHCAINEAKNGGSAVAYVVRNDELNTIKNLQAPEIFYDKDRGIEGIHPLERIRLRRFTGPNDVNILIPELRTYGTKHVGFRDRVTDWSRNVQKNTVDFKNPPDFDEFDLRGGSYQDNPADDLWNNFFDTDTASGKKKSIDKDEEGIDADDLHAQAQNALDGHIYNHVSVYFDVEEGDGEPFIYPSVDISFPFPEDQFIKEITSKDLQTWRQKDEHPLGYYIKGILDFSVEDIDIDTDNNILYIRCRLHTEIYHDADEFERKLDELDDVDKKYHEYHREIRNLLSSMGFLGDWTESWNKFKHFKFDSDDPPEIESQYMWIGDLQGVASENIDFITSSSSHELPRFSFSHEFVKQLMARIFPRDQIIGQAIEPDDIFFSLPARILDGGKQLKSNPVIQYPYKLYLNIKKQFPERINAEQRMLSLIHYIDQNWDFFEKRAAQVWEQIKPTLTKPGYQWGIPNTEKPPTDWHMPPEIRGKVNYQFPPQQPKPTHYQKTLGFQDHEDGV